MTNTQLISCRSLFHSSVCKKQHEAALYSNKTDGPFMFKCRLVMEIVNKLSPMVRFVINREMRNVWLDFKIFQTILEHCI